MTAPRIQIKRLLRRKSSGEVIRVDSDKEIAKIRIRMNIRYKPIDRPRADSMNVFFTCKMSDASEDETNPANPLEAIVEIIYQAVFADTYDVKNIDIDSTMHFLWPYLRESAALQLQQIGLGKVAQDLPYVVPDKGDKDGQPNE